jgi:hypothetical protein
MGEGGYLFLYLHIRREMNADPKHCALTNGLKQCGKQFTAEFLSGFAKQEAKKGDKIQMALQKRKETS